MYYTGQVDIVFYEFGNKIKHPEEQLDWGSNTYF